MAKRYRAETDENRVVRLTDGAADVVVSVAVGQGNRAYEMKVRGENVLGAGFGLNGIPLLAPWANRMAGGGFWANGKWHPLPGRDGIAMHGLVLDSPLWEVTDLGGDEGSAWVTSRLEFGRFPELMRHWPMAHEYEMTYRLAGGALEVETAVVNRSGEPMPVALGYHPYFRLPGVARDEAVAHIPARKAVVADDRLVATGEMRDAGLPERIPLKGGTFDDGFTDLVRDERGRATFRMEGGGKRIEAAFGPKWLVGVVWAPAGEEFICFEPMAGITNGVNLAHEGKYGEQQVLAPGAVWRESFWIRAIL